MPLTVVSSGAGVQALELCTNAGCGLVAKSFFSARRCRLYRLKYITDVDIEAVAAPLRLATETGDTPETLSKGNDTSCGLSTCGPLQNEKDEYLPEQR